ncbi:hypothetical protein H920_12760 [Fukomys damarensis]|uniref:Uncharacterized protein n=1 Tax=Fukomys damarensis TaxID=885580 RepID=A0A091D485_FUKDA|nr:hypothetical protein H920_12760 [Fukomys damarensis]
MESKPLGGAPKVPVVKPRATQMAAGDRVPLAGMTDFCHYTDFTLVFSLDNCGIMSTSICSSLDWKAKAVAAAGSRHFLPGAQAAGRSPRHSCALSSDIGPRQMPKDNLRGRQPTLRTAEVQDGIKLRLCTATQEINAVNSHFFQIQTVQHFVFLIGIASFYCSSFTGERERQCETEKKEKGANIEKQPRSIALDPHMRRPPWQLRINTVANPPSSCLCTIS